MSTFMGISESDMEKLCPSCMEQGSHTLHGTMHCTNDGCRVVVYDDDL